MSADLLDSMKRYLNGDFSVYVDYKTSLGFVGSVLKYMAVAPLLPTLVALYYGESPVPFLATSGVMVTSGLALERLRSTSDLGNREAFLLVSLTWFLVPLLGTLPYLIAGNGTVASRAIASFSCVGRFSRRHKRRPRSRTVV